MSIKATINTQSKIIPSSVNVLAGAGTVVGANFNSPVIISGTLQGNTKFLDTPQFGGASFDSPITVSNIVASPGVLSIVGNIQTNNINSRAIHKDGNFKVINASDDGGGGTTYDNIINVSNSSMTVGLHTIGGGIRGNYTHTFSGKNTDFNVSSNGGDVDARFGNTGDGANSLKVLGLQNTEIRLSANGGGATGATMLVKGTDDTSGWSFGLGGTHFSMTGQPANGGTGERVTINSAYSAGFYFNKKITISSGGLSVTGTPAFSSSPQIPGFKITSNTPNVRTELGLGTSASPKTLNVFTKITNSPNENIVIESQRGPGGGGDITLTCGRDFSLTSDTLTLNGGKMVLGSGLADMFKLDSTGTGMSNLINVNGATNQVTINGPLTTGTSSTADVKLGSSGLIFDASQNMIGIGTSAPGYKLDVLGDVRFQGPNILLNCGILDVPGSVNNTHRLGNKIRTNILESNTVDLKITGLPTYDSESAAASAGLAQDTVYKTSTGELRIKL